MYLLNFAAVQLFQSRVIQDRAIQCRLIQDLVFQFSSIQVLIVSYRLN